MTAQPETSSRPIQTPHRQPGSEATFVHVLKSEWIKVTTVPSTVILIIVTVIVMVGLAALSAWSFTLVAQSDGELLPNQVATEGFGSTSYMALTVPSSGIAFGQLLIASLAVVLVASEWATGMIRSTMIAVPTRLPALLAKTAVIAGIAFLVGVSSAFISYLIAQPILQSENLEFSMGEDGVLASITNTGTFLALVAILSMSIGILLRNTAGGVVTTIGIFFVLPAIVALVAGLADWIPDTARFLPSAAGTQITAIAIRDGELTQWQGALAMGAWAFGLLAIALVVAKKRDV